MKPAKIVGFCSSVVPAQGCMKVPYSNKQQAYNVIRSNKGKRGRKECRVYKCEECGAWHLTSQRR